MLNIAVLLFENFETLDVYGPVEIFGRLIDKYTIDFYSLNGGLIKNRHGVLVSTKKMDNLPNDLSVFIIPGGIGTRVEVDNKELIACIEKTALQSQYVLTICTGSALLAKTGLLNGRQATSNKRAFSWVKSNGLEVIWNPIARWVIDGKYYSSSGVSAGIDMSLGFVADQYGYDLAKQLAIEIEYIWNEDKNKDDFVAE